MLLIALYSFAWVISLLGCVNYFAYYLSAFALGSVWASRFGDHKRKAWGAGALYAFQGGGMFLFLVASVSVRLLYLVLVAAGAAWLMPVGLNFLLSELPTYLFFSLFLLLLLRWIAVVRKSRGKSLSLSAPKWALVTWLVINALMYLLFLVFVIVVFATTDGRSPSSFSTKSSNSACSSDTTPFISSPAGIVGMVYKALLALLLLIIAVLLFLYEVRIVRWAWKLRGQQLKLFPWMAFLRLNAVLVCTTVAMGAQMVLVVLLNADVVMPPAAAAVLLIFVELLPILVLVWLLNKTPACTVCLSPSKPVPKAENRYLRPRGNTGDCLPNACLWFWRLGGTEAFENMSSLSDLNMHTHRSDIADPDLASNCPPRVNKTRILKDGTRVTDVYGDGKLIIRQPPVAGREDDLTGENVEGHSPGRAASSEDRPRNTEDSQAGLPSLSLPANRRSDFEGEGCESGEVWVAMPSETF